MLLRHVHICQRQDHAVIDPLDDGKADEWGSHSYICMSWVFGLCCQVFPCQARCCRSGAHHRHLTPRARPHTRPGAQAQVLIGIAGKKVAEKYRIREPVENVVLKATCCTCCYAGQIQNEVMVRERLEFGCAQLQRRALGAQYGAPAPAEMNRQMSGHL